FDPEIGAASQLSGIGERARAAGNRRHRDPDGPRREDVSDLEIKPVGRERLAQAAAVGSARERTGAAVKRADEIDALAVFDSSRRGARRAVALGESVQRGGAPSGQETDADRDNARAQAAAHGEAHEPPNYIGV